MNWRMVVTLAVLSIVLSGATEDVCAGWVENGTGICTEEESQEHAVVVADGAGGAFIVWSDSRNTNFDIYAQRIDPHGNILWGAGGMPVCTESSSQTFPSAVPDGAGGIIVAWSDYRNSNDDIYAQRLDADGNPLWAGDGVPVITHTSDQQPPQMVPDGEGGAILAWSDERISYYDIYAQRIDATGTPLWTANGIAVCTADNYQYLDDIAEDGDGGAVVTWHDLRNGSDFDIYAQRIYGDGTFAWTSGGVAVCTSAGSQAEARITMDISGAFIIAWRDVRSGDADIYAQKLNRYGGNRWMTDGVAACVYSAYQDSPAIVSDGEWGAFIVWRDYRGSSSQIYGQRMTGSGTPAWGSSGVPICDYTNVSMYNPNLVADGDGGAIVSWLDYRSGVNFNPVAQRIDSNYNRLWESTGVPVRVAADEATDIVMIPDGDGGAIFAWKDYRNGDSDVYANRIERNGYWGYPSASITEARDVPGDQGGWINLKWDASRLDPWPECGIDNYTVWRAIGESQATAMLKDGAKLIEDVSLVSRTPLERGASTTRGGALAGAADSPTPGSGPLLRLGETTAGDFYWELVATVDSYELEHYSATVPTLFDSSGATAEHTYFQVIAHGYSTSKYWISAVDSGWSVDNLAPSQPLGLSGEQSFSPEGLQLTWDPNTESDLAGYNVYRGTSGTFEPDEANFVASTADTALFDDGWSWEPGYWYKVSAVDIHGNESPFAVLSPETVTGDEPAPLPRATFLAQNYPNPFNPSTTIAFGLKESAGVTLRIYDAAGRLVRTLAGGAMKAGRHEVSWNGLDDSGKAVSSGVYFYRLNAGEFEETRKMILLR